MADSVVSVTAGRVASLQDLTAIKITVTYSSTSYTTASGGLPFDLFSVLQTAGPYPIDSDDILGFVPLSGGVTAEKFLLGAFAVGTVTSTTVPCTIRIYGTGGSEKAALTEVDNASLTGSFTGLLLVAKGAQA